MVFIGTSGFSRLSVVNHHNDVIGWRYIPHSKALLILFRMSHNASSYDVIIMTYESFKISNFFFRFSTQVNCLYCYTTAYNDTRTIIYDEIKCFLYNLSFAGSLMTRSSNHPLLPVNFDHFSLFFSKKKNKRKNGRIHHWREFYSTKIVSLQVFYKKIEKKYFEYYFLLSKNQKRGYQRRSLFSVPIVSRSFLFLVFAKMKHKWAKIWKSSPLSLFWAA